MRDDAMERLLQWRLAAAESEAPLPPRAALLIELAQPWWETWPQRLRERIDRLQRMPATLGFAQETNAQPQRGHPVATLLALEDDVEAYAWVLYLSVRDGWLRLRFILQEPVPATPDSVEATLIADGETSAPFAGRATRAPNGEYRVDVELPAPLAEEWELLRAAERMPFRLVLTPHHESR